MTYPVTKVGESCFNSKCSTPPVDIKNYQLCGQCRSVSYCARACQVADWPHHKKDCQSLKERVSAGAAVGGAAAADQQVTPTPIRSRGIMQFKKPIESAIHIWLHGHHIFHENSLTLTDELKQLVEDKNFGKDLISFLCDFFEQEELLIPPKPEIKDRILQGGKPKETADNFINSFLESFFMTFNLEALPLNEKCFHPDIKTIPNFDKIISELVCYTYAFLALGDLDAFSNWIELPADRCPRKDFLEKQGYTAQNIPKKGDLIAYMKGEEVVHVGIVLAAEPTEAFPEATAKNPLIESKWGSVRFISIHKPEEVPETFGTHFIYMRPSEKLQPIYAKRELPPLDQELSIPIPSPAGFY